MLQKVITTLGIVIGSVIVVVFALTVLLPNTATGLVGSVEKAIYSATGMSFDLNGDNHVGAADGNNFGGTKQQDNVMGIGQDLNLEGFGGFNGSGGSH